MDALPYFISKSFGIGVKSDGKPMVLNLCLKGLPKPVKGSCKTTLTGEHKIISEFEIKVYENDSEQKLIGVDSCNLVHKPVKFQFKEETYGDDNVHIQLINDENWVVTVKLFNERTFEYFEVIAKRLSEDVEEVSSGELRLG